MSHVIKLSIPDELAGRIDDKRSDQTLQEYTLAALRSAVYGSPVEAGLLAEIERLHQTLRAFGTNAATEHTTTAPTSRGPAQQAVAPAEDNRIGW